MVGHFIYYFSVFGVFLFNFGAWTKWRCDGSFGSRYFIFCFCLSVWLVSTSVKSSRRGSILCSSDILFSVWDRLYQNITEPQTQFEKFLIWKIFDIEFDLELSSFDFIDLFLNFWKYRPKLRCKPRTILTWRWWTPIRFEFVRHQTLVQD